MLDDSGAHTKLIWLWFSCLFISITFQFSSVQSLDRLGRRGAHDRRFSGDSPQVFFFSARGPCEQFWREQGCPLFDVIHPEFPLLTMVSPTLQGALKNGFGEAVVACDMPEPCKFLSLDSCEKRSLRTHKEVNLATHPVSSLVLQIGDRESYLLRLVLKAGTFTTPFVSL